MRLIIFVHLLDMPLKMDNKVILIGGFIEIIELCEDSGVEILGVVDKIKSKDFKLIGTDKNVNNWKNQYIGNKIIITPDVPSIRENLAQLYKDFSAHTLISHRAIVSKSSNIGKGTVVQANVNISSQVELGSFVKVNSCANIMHNAKIGDFSTIAPNAVVLGYVKVGKGCYIGANATILPNITIADKVVIGAGAVVTKNIIEIGAVYTGVPAKRIK